MDWSGLLVGTVVVIAALAIALASPAMLRLARRRRLRRDTSLAGLGSGLDVVWRPSVEEARAEWEASIELPAPAPTPGDKALETGRITITLP